MKYWKTDFVLFSANAQQSIANLETGYEQLVDIERELEAMPTSMFWKSKNGKDYLAVKKTTFDFRTTQGVGHRRPNASSPNTRQNASACKCAGHR